MEQLMLSEGASPEKNIRKEGGISTYQMQKNDVFQLEGMRNAEVEDSRTSVNVRRC